MVRMQLNTGRINHLFSGILQLAKDVLRKYQGICLQAVQLNDEAKSNIKISVKLLGSVHTKFSLMCVGF